MFDNPRYFSGRVELARLDLKSEVHSMPVGGVCHLNMVSGVAFDNDMSEAVGRRHDNV